MTSKATDPMNAKNESLNRRALLRGAAVVSATAAVAAACGATPSPGVDGGTGGGTGTLDAGGVFDAGVVNTDIANLNALLSAEYKAIDAYTQGAGVLTADTSDLGKLVLAVAVEFQSDHRAHAVLLAKTITDLGGTPVTEAANKFTLPTGFKASTPNVMKLAANAERAAAVAYNQVLKGLTSKTNRFIAAAIEGDETQHYVVLVALIEGLVMPTANLTPTTNADKVVPQPFVSATTELGGASGLQSETDQVTNDLM